MIDDWPIGKGIIFFVMILIIACFYGFGAAIQALNSSELEEELEKKNKKAVLIKKFWDAPTSLVNTIHLIVTLLTIVIGRFLLNDILDLVVALFLILTFGILVPKRLAIKYSTSFTYKLIYPIYICVTVFSPITFIINQTSNLIIRLFGVNPHDLVDDVTEEEIISMVNEVQEQGGILDSEAEMISNIFELGDKDAKDIMTHRTGIIFIDCEMSLGDALKYGLEQDYSRFPVYEESIDNVIGVVNLKDLMIKYNEGKESRNTAIKHIKGLIRETSYIPETRDANVLFKTMQSEHLHMVVVVDEYGQTAGIVTMEDILEEIVGNIVDEYDHEDALIIDQNNGCFLINGMAELEDVEEALDISFDLDDCDTFNGFIMSQLDKIPSEDEDICITYGNYEFKVLSMDNKIIRMVRAKKLSVDDENVSNSV